MPNIANDVWTYGTVTQLSPLKVRLDGEADALAGSVTSLVESALWVGARLRIQIHNRQIIATGVVNGVPEALLDALAADMVSSGLTVYEQDTLPVQAPAGSIWQDTSNTPSTFYFSKDGYDSGTGTMADWTAMSDGQALTLAEAAAVTTPGATMPPSAKHGDFWLKDDVDPAVTYICTTAYDIGMGNQSYWVEVDFVAKSLAGTALDTANAASGAVAGKSTILYAPGVTVTDANGTAYAPDPAVVGSQLWPVATQWVDTSIVTETDSAGDPVLDDNNQPITYQPFDQYTYDGSVWQHSQFSFDVNLALSAVSSTVDSHHITLYGDPNDPNDTGLVGSLGLTANNLNAFIALIQGVIGYDAANDVWPTLQTQDPTLSGIAGTNPTAGQILVATDTNTFQPANVVAWALQFMGAHDTTAAQDLLNVYDATTVIGDVTGANFVNTFLSYL